MSDSRDCELGPVAWSVFRFSDSLGFIESETSDAKLKLLSNLIERDVLIVRTQNTGHWGCHFDDTLVKCCLCNCARVLTSNFELNKSACILKDTWDII